jgi:hypothetical protein
MGRDGNSSRVSLVCLPVKLQCLICGFLGSGITTNRSVLCSARRPSLKTQKLAITIMYAIFTSLRLHYSDSDDFRRPYRYKHVFSSPSNYGHSMLTLRNRSGPWRAQKMSMTRFSSYASPMHRLSSTMLHSLRRTNISRIASG